MCWKTLLAAVSGQFNEEFVRQIDFLKAENKILKEQIKGRLRLNDAERRALAELRRSFCGSGMVKGPVNCCACCEP